MSRSVTSFIFPMMIHILQRAGEKLYTPLFPHLGIPNKNHGHTWTHVSKSPSLIWQGHFVKSRSILSWSSNTSLTRNLITFRSSVQTNLFILSASEKEASVSPKIDRNHSMKTKKGRLGLIKMPKHLLCCFSLPALIRRQRREIAHSRWIFKGFFKHAKWHWRHFCSTIEANHMGVGVFWFNWLTSLGIEFQELGFQLYFTIVHT